MYFVFCKCFDFKNWNFDLNKLQELTSGHTIRIVVKEVFKAHDIMNEFNINPDKLENFLDALEHGYGSHQNPYHNAEHACQVVHSVHCFLLVSGITKFYTELEIFALLFAAIIHDFEHTGKTNGFHINVYSELALLYNDIAVQENHHVSSSFRILKIDQCNILSDLNQSEFHEFRKLVIDLVLATDMSAHFQLLRDIRAYLKAEKWVGTVEKAITTTMSLILHGADISNPGKIWSLHKKAVDLIMREFFEQGDEERKRGLPISPLCDRKTTNIPMTQMTFIEVIVEPTLTVLGDMFDLLRRDTEDAIITIVRNRNKIREKGHANNNNNNRPAGNKSVLHPMPSRERARKGSGSGKQSIPGNQNQARSSVVPPTLCPRPWVIPLKQNKEKWKQLIALAAIQHEIQDPTPKKPSFKHFTKQISKKSIK